jgi:hypothetical protein
MADARIDIEVVQGDDAPPRTRGGHVAGVTAEHEEADG